MTLRLRLTLIYGGLFLVAGITLVALSYTLVRRNLPPGNVSLEVPPPGDLVEGSNGLGQGEAFLQATPEEIGTLQQAVDRFRSDTLRGLLVQSVGALAVAAVAAAGLGWAVAGRVLRPVHEITETARRLSEQNLHERLNLAGPHDELRELADTFDGMLARLDAAFDNQSRFVANAAHELRTPLAIMRTELEVAQRDPTLDREQLLAVTARVQLVVRRTERLIEGLLAMARGARGLRTREPVDLADVAHDAMTDLDGELGSVTVTTDLEPAPTAGDPDLLAHLATNLVANAARHNVPGGWIDVRTTRGNGHPSLTVTNSGPIVRPEDTAALFEPFTRGAPDRTASDRGSGLGLSIVRAVVDAHGGTVDLVAREAGGLAVTVTIPAGG